MALNLEQFAAQPRVLDGAWGTELQALGLAAGSCPELWNVDNPAAVEQVAASYVQAGADVILTNTFGGNRFILGGHGLASRTAELCEAGAAISKRAAGSAASVFGSIGPSGKIVMMEEVSQDELAAGFAEAAEALQWGGVDALVLETFNELDELRLALRAIRNIADVPVVACMTFSAGADRSRTIMGNAPEDFAKVAVSEGADAIGANCGVGPDNYVAIAQRLRSACKLPVWIKANAGLPQRDHKGATYFPMGPKAFADCVPGLLAAGASFIGGCCGTTPAHIRAVRAAITGL